MNSWRSILFVVTPMVFLPLVFHIGTTEAKAAYGVIIMGVFWMAEVIPLPATALMPMFLFPMLGVMGAKDIAKNYLKDTNMLIVGGLMFAVAIESSNLHRRIALGILKIVGVKRRWLMLGFMLPTWFLSMWISNTATTAMMFPVAQAVLDQFERGRRAADRNGQLKTPKNDAIDGHVNDGFEKDSNGASVIPMQMITPDESSTDPTAAESTTTDGEDNDHSDFCKCLALSIAYSANVGGVATLTGSPPNLVFMNAIDDIYEEHHMESPITFTSWMIFGFPLSTMCIVLAWIWLQVFYLNAGRCWKKADEDDPEVERAVAEIVRKEYDQCGKFRFAEGACIFFFFLLVGLWFFRDPRFIPGWSSFFEKGFLTDASCAIFICIFLYACPKSWPRFDGSKSPGALLDWKSVGEKFPWGVVLLIGGGFALADVSKVSGLSEWIGSRMVVLGALPNWSVVVLVAVLVAALTEFTSNTATSALLLPIIGELSIDLGMNPLYLMFPGVIAASFAFMLPVATPPNAIVFANGYLKVTDMAKAGLMMNIIYSQHHGSTLSYSQHHSSALIYSQHHGSALSYSQHHDSALSYSQHHDSALRYSQHHGNALWYSQHHGSALRYSQHHGSALRYSQHHGSALRYSQHHGSALRYSQHHGSALRYSQHHGSAMRYSQHHGTWLQPSYSQVQASHKGAHQSKHSSLAVSRSHIYVSNLYAQIQQ
ncbi:Solute carrier family 13 member 5 [Lamellibrachia satsuma]|nr:Solute carrier family 13 member 5 [Lamellibrachia satsuma]